MPALVAHRQPHIATAGIAQGHQPAETIRVTGAQCGASERELAAGLRLPYHPEPGSIQRGGQVHAYRAA
jgi:hypothetical protein